MNTEFCRLCADEYHIKLLVNIFADEHLHRAIRSKIFSVLQINVKIDDTLSKNVCLVCLGRLDEVCRFIEECFEAQIRLKNRTLDDVQSVQVKKRTCEESEFTETAPSKKKPRNIETPDTTDVIDTFPADADDQSSDDDSIDSSHHNVGDISDTQCDNLTGCSAELLLNNLQSQQGCNLMDVQDLCTTTDDEEDCEIVYDIDLACTNVASVTSDIVNTFRTTSLTPVNQVRKSACEESEFTETAPSMKKPRNIETPDTTDVIDTFPADADDHSSDDDSIDGSHHNVGDISDTQGDNLTGCSVELPPNNLQSQLECNSMDVQDLCTTTDDEEDCEIVYDILDLACTNVASATSGIVNTSRRTSLTPVNENVNGNVNTLSVNSIISYIIDQLSTERQNNNIELIEDDETATDINSGDVLLEEWELSASSNAVQYVSDYTSDNITSDNGRDDNIRTNKIAFIQDDTSRSGNIRTNEIATSENGCGIASVVSSTAVCDQVIDLTSDGHSCSSAAPENTTDNCDGNDDENGVNDLLSANIETNVVGTCSDLNPNECKSTTLVDFKIMLNNQVFVELCQQYRIVYDNSQPADINNCCIDDNDRSKNKRNSDNGFKYNLRHRKDVKAAITIDDFLFEEDLDDYDLDSLYNDETDSDDSDFIVSANESNYYEEIEVDCNLSYLSATTTTATNIDDNTNHSEMDYYYDSSARGIENRCRSNEFSNIIIPEKRKSNNNIFNHRKNFLIRPSPTTEQLQRLDLLLPEMKIKSVNAKCNINDILKAVLPSYNFDVNNFEFRFRYDNLKYRLPRNRLILISGSKYILAAFDTDSTLRMLNERKLNRLFLTLIHNSIVTVTGGSENTATANSVDENHLSEGNISVFRYIETDKLENIPRIFRSQISSCAFGNGILLIRDFHQSGNILSNLASIFNGKKLVICQSCSDGNMYVSFSALKLYNNPTVDQSQKVGGMDNVCDDSRTTELLDHLYAKRNSFSTVRRNIMERNRVPASEQMNFRPNDRENSSLLPRTSSRFIENNGGLFAAELSLNNFEILFDKSMFEDELNVNSNGDIIGNGDKDDRTSLSIHTNSNYDGVGRSVSLNSTSPIVHETYSSTDETSQLTYISSSFDGSTGESLSPNIINPNKNYRDADYVEICIDTERRYQCMKCMSVLKNKDGMMKHLKHVHTEPTFQCPRCPKKAVTLGLLMNHLKHVHTEPTFQCPRCPKRAVTLGLLTKHIQTVHVKPFVCSQCNKAFGTSTHMKVHENYVHGPFVKCVCDICGNVYKSGYHMNRHKRDVHTRRATIA